MTRSVWIVPESFQETDVGAIILAAGASTRMGGAPKQLLQFGGETLLRRAALVALEASCRPVIVVTGANAAAARDSLHGLDVCKIDNQQWQSGMSSSLRTGIDELMAVNPEASAAIIMLCDQPLVTSELIRGLISAHRETNCSIVASRYANSYGVPALFARSHFAELRELKGDEGAKAIIKRHFAQAHLLPFPNGEIDIDTPADFARLQSMT
ncbi:MAG TPA: nucleotidyltransferase family protein [Chthoniobacterales bacterium]|jgi:molybdenum cofactor cytidylyltransferase|nr:nucleotidyltransferase family protein [Chthoniobacterales bacterium]